jgi:hypothetical protein
LAIVADNGSGVNKVVWYEVSSNTVTTGVSDSDVLSFPSSLEVSDTGSFWVNWYRKLTFASTTVSTLYSTSGGSRWGESYTHPIYGAGTFFKITFYNQYWIAPDGLHDISNNIVASYPNNNQGILCHINNGITLFDGFLRSTLMNNPSLAWTNYGWNGSSWDTVSTGSKTCHTDQETLINGLTIAFQNGTTTPQFVLNEFFTQGVCKGLLKDNATSVVFNPQWYSKPITYDTVSVTIPNTNTINLPATSNPFFRSVDTDTTGVHSFTINGVAVTHIWTDSTTPASSEINLQASGVVTFNSADQGKTFSGNYLWIGV